MDDRSAEIERLTRSLSDARVREATLAVKVREYEATLTERRRELGNPFFYSGKQPHPGKTVAQYTGYKSHEPGLALVRAAQALQQEIQSILDELRALGVE
jgi:hypothetical protein